MTYFCINGEPVGLTGRRVFMVTIINWKQFLVYLFIIALSFHLMFYLYYYLELLSLTLLGDELYSEEYYSMGKGNMNMKSFNKLFSESDIKKDVSSYKPINNSVIFESKSFNRQLISQTSLSAVSDNIMFKDFKSLDLKFNKVSSFNNIASQHFFYSNIKDVTLYNGIPPFDLSHITISDLIENTYIFYVSDNSDIKQKDYLEQNVSDFSKNSKFCKCLKNANIHKLVVYEHKITNSFFYSALTSHKGMPCNASGLNILSPFKVLQDVNFMGKLTSSGQFITQPVLVTDLKMHDTISNIIFNRNLEDIKVSLKYSNYDFNKMHEEYIQNKYIYKNQLGLVYSKGQLVECCNLVDDFINIKNNK